MASNPKTVGRVKSVLAGIASKDLLDSKRLFYFYHVARLGSLTTAEAVLDVAQSAISRQIQQLEADVGEMLLLRTGRGVTLTQAGDLLYKQAGTILQEMSSTMELMDQMKRRPAQVQITFASPPTFSNIYMPHVISRFVEAFPQVRLIAYEASTGQVFDYLASGHVDLAIVLHASTSQKLKLQKLVTEPLLLMASRNHPISKMKVVERHTLAQLEMILPFATHGSRALVESYCEEGGLHLDPRLRLDSLGMTKAVMKEGKFCSILPKLACLEEIKSGEIVGLPLIPSLKRTVYLASLRDRPQTAHMKALSREISRVMREKIGDSQDS